MTTLEALQAEFGGPTAPLAAVTAKYLNIKNRYKANEMAKAGTLPIPSFRLGSIRSPRMVHLKDLAELIDSQADEARGKKHDAVK